MGYPSSVSQENKWMAQEKIKSLYTSMVSDPDFDRLELGLKKPNIFDVLKVETNEVRHSNFVAWLLDPNGSHKLGNIFLKRFLRQVFASNKFSSVSSIDVEAFPLEKIQIQREWKNIDILISSDEFVVCIENKIFSKEHSNQLNRYKTIIEENFPNQIKTFVYLSPEGIPSETETESYEPLSYEFLADLIERVLSVHGDTFDDRVKTYLKDYAVTVRRDIMKNDELTELAKTIYKNHKEILDFIAENRPEFVNHIHELMIEAIEARNWILGSLSKHYVRFSTPDITDLIYYNKSVKNGWKNSESFQFEIQLYPSSNKFIFRTVIAPSDPSYDIAQLEQTLLEIEGSKPSKGRKWLVNFSTNMRFNYEEAENLTDDEITEEIECFLNKIEPTVKAVAGKFLENEIRLRDLKQRATDQI